jgi:Uma2 family endonuclease
MQTSEGVVVRHHVPGFSERWVIVEEKVPEAPIHDACVELFRLLLVAWIARAHRDAHAYRNVAIRVRADRPQLGFDPDVCLVEPAPADAGEIDSLRLWLPGHSPPVLALEVVSKNHPYKDYTESPDKCAAAGVAELVVFDPLRTGPKAHGGRALVQVWRRAADGGFDRVYFGDGPVWSASLDAWLVTTEFGKRLRIADDERGTKLWLTGEEAARQSADAALSRVAELEAELARRGG